MGARQPADVPKSPQGQALPRREALLWGASPAPYTRPRGLDVGHGNIWAPRAWFWLRAVTSHLSHRVGQRLDDLLVGRGHHALPVDLDDAVAHADAAPLRDAPAHEAADLSDTGAGGGRVSTGSPPRSPVASSPQRRGGESITHRMKPQGRCSYMLSADSPTWEVTVWNVFENGRPVPPTRPRWLESATPSHPGPLFLGQGCGGREVGR